MVLLLLPYSRHLLSRAHGDLPTPRAESRLVPKSGRSHPPIRSRPAPACSRSGRRDRRTAAVRARTPPAGSETYSHRHVPAADRHAHAALSAYVIPIWSAAPARATGGRTRQSEEWQPHKPAEWRCGSGSDACRNRTRAITARRHPSTHRTIGRRRHAALLDTARQMYHRRSSTGGAAPRPRQPPSSQPPARPHGHRDSWPCSPPPHPRLGCRPVSPPAPRPAGAASP
jgi:hypothetical protein